MLKKSTLPKLLLLTCLVGLTIYGCQKEPLTPGNGTEIKETNIPAANSISEILPHDNTHVITNEEAVYLMDRFKNNYPSLKSTGYFSADAVKSVLDQSGLDRVKFYFGKKLLTNNPELFVLGINATNDDMVEGKILAAVFYNNLPVAGNILNWVDNTLVNPVTAGASTALHRTLYPALNYGGSFTEDAVRAIVVEEGVVGVRADIGLTDENKWTLILRGTASDGSINANALIIDKALMCPPTCGSLNILNSL